MALFINFLISNKLFHIAVYFLVYFLCRNAVLAKDNILLHRIFATENYTLETTNAKLFFKFDMLLITKVNRHFPRAWDMQGKVLEISVTDQNGKSINLKSCKLLQKISDSLEKPFTTVYDENGLFEKLMVLKDDVDISINLKLFINTFSQLDNTKLTKQLNSHKPVQASEYVFLGNCDVLYDIENYSSSPNKQLNVTKRYDVNSCTFINKTFPEPFLTEICSEVKNSRQIIFLGPRLEVDFEKDNFPFIVNNIHMINKISYIPFKNSLIKLHGDMAWKIKFQEIKNFEWNPEFEEAIKVDKKEFIFRKVNKTLFEDVNNTKNEAMRNFYKTFACNGYNINVHLSLLEEMLSCDI